MTKQIPILFSTPMVEAQPEIIRALWWNQPFASLMLPPFDKDETRKRKTNVRGKVLICACKRPYDIEVVNEIAGNDQYRRIVQTQIMDWVDDNDMVGKAIGIGELVDCYPMKPEHEDKCYVQYKPGLWVWKFANVQHIEPFEISGKQGWAILNKDTIAKIKVLSTTGKPENI
jgi:hypothetical protein